MSDPAPEQIEILSSAFFYLHDLFRAPSAAQWDHLHAERTLQVWQTLAPRFDLPPRMPLPPEPDRYEAEYIQTFDAGVPSPPVPLTETAYNKRDPLPKILHENVLFYQALGLRLKGSSLEQADHLRHQLEFVGYVLRLEAAAHRVPEESGKAEQLRRARVDYLNRHLLSWLPAAVKAAQSAAPLWARYFLQMTEALARTAVRDEPAEEPPPTSR